MVQTYQGYFKEGRFISPGVDEIPDYTEVYIIVTSSAVPAEKPFKKLNARGIFKDSMNVDMIAGEKGAWERSVLERYAEDNS
jgi:hypothetical protein